LSAMPAMSCDVGVPKIALNAIFERLTTLR